MKHHAKFGISFQLKVPTQKDPNEMITFRKLLLNRCQREFERDKTQEVDFANMHKDIENATSVSKKHHRTDKSPILCINSVLIF